jgi:hypothetical protein
MRTVHTDLFVKKAAAAAVAAAMLTAFAACNNDKLYSNPEMTASQNASQPEATSVELTYDSVNNFMKQFDEELNLYMVDHHDEATVKEGDGTSYAGNPAYTVYTVSADGKYRALQMEKVFDDRTVVDEYFDTGDAMIFARTTVYNNGDFDPVEKYYITGGTVYKLDSETKTLVSVVDIDSDSAAQMQTDLDMYFSFDEIVALYG